MAWADPRLAGLRGVWDRQTAPAARGSEGREGRGDQVKDLGEILDAAGTPRGEF